MVGERCRLTELEPIWDTAASGEVLVILHGFPDIPAPQIVYDLAARIFDVVPFQQWDPGLVDKALDIEDFAEGDDGCRRDVRRREHGDHGDAVGDYSKVYEINVGHNIVSWQRTASAI